MFGTNRERLSVGVLLAMVATILAIVSDAGDLIDRWRASGEVQASENGDVPAPPEAQRATDPLAERLRSDLAERLAQSCGDSLRVPALAERATPATETSHGMDGQFYQATIDLPGAEQPLRFDVVGTGRGPAAAQDAYEDLIAKVLERLGTLAPECLA